MSDFFTMASLVFVVGSGIRLATPFLLAALGEALQDDMADTAGPAVLHASPAEPLTRKELRVLELLASGYSNAAMAEKLFVSDSTVRTHLRNINSKLNARSRTEAVAIARKARVI